VYNKEIGKTGENLMMPQWKGFLKILLSCLAVLSLQSCSDEDKAYYLHYDGYQVPNPHKHLVLYDVYSYQQTTNFTCGPSVVMTLMLHYGKLTRADMNQATEMQFAKEMKTNILGTSQIEMVNFLRKHGFKVDYGQDVTLSMIVDNINRGIPTIIVWNDINEHSMLVIGYHSDGVSPEGSKDKIFIADPESTGYVIDNGNMMNGVDSLSPEQLEMNQTNARVFFNPTHSAVGMYITAVPN
jgi:hypothetical protein